MTRNRLAAAVFVVTALLAQVVVINRWTLPGGAPNLVIAVVLALALVEGPGPGMAYGFAGGFLADLLSTHTVGQLALVWTVASYLVGLLSKAERTTEVPVLAPLIAMSALSGAVTLAFAGLSVVAGSPHEAVGRIVEQAVAVAAYGFVLAPFVYGFTGLVLGRLAARGA